MYNLLFQVRDSTVWAKSLQSQLEVSKQCLHVSGRLNIVIAFCMCMFLGEGQEDRRPGSPRSSAVADPRDHNGASFRGGFRSFRGVGHRAEGNNNSWPQM